MNAEEEKERRDGDECGIILSSSYSFLSERCCASPKAALLSFSLWGKTTREFFLGVCFLGVFCFGVKSPCWTHPTKATVGFLSHFFFYSSSREVGVNKN